MDSPHLSLRKVVSTLASFRPATKSPREEPPRLGGCGIYVSTKEGLRDARWSRIEKPTPCRAIMLPAFCEDLLSVALHLQNNDQFAKKESDGLCVSAAICFEHQVTDELRRDFLLPDGHGKLQVCLEARRDTHFVFMILHHSLSENVPGDRRQLRTQEYLNKYAKPMLDRGIEVVTKEGVKATLRVGDYLRATRLLEVSAEYIDESETPSLPTEETSAAASAKSAKATKVAYAGARELPPKYAIVKGDWPAEMLYVPSDFWRHIDQPKRDVCPLSEALRTIAEERQRQNPARGARFDSIAVDWFTRGIQYLPEHVTDILYKIWKYLSHRGYHFVECQKYYATEEMGGIPDLILAHDDGHYAILDWKRTDNKTDLASHLSQVILYAGIMMKKLNMPVRAVYIVYVRTMGAAIFKYGIANEVGTLHENVKNIFTEALPGVPDKIAIRSFERSKFIDPIKRQVMEHRDAGGALYCIKAASNALQPPDETKSVRKAAKGTSDPQLEVPAKAVPPVTKKCAAYTKLVSEMRPDETYYVSPVRDPVVIESASRRLSESHGRRMPQENWLRAMADAQNELIIQGIRGFMNGSSLAHDGAALPEIQQFFVWYRRMSLKFAVSARKYVHPDLIVLSIKDRTEKDAYVLATFEVFNEEEDRDRWKRDTTKQIVASNMEKHLNAKPFAGRVLRAYHLLLRRAYWGCALCLYKAEDGATEGLDNPPKLLRSKSTFALLNQAGTFLADQGIAETKSAPVVPSDLRRPATARVKRP